jgi:4-amino-4-deoxy-L-arabinose transferase-like glycosyltransferase
LRSAGAILAALAITALALFLVHDHTREDSFSADEPIHILSGYLEVFGKTAIVNIEHPPLMKALAGLALKSLPLPEPPVPLPMGQLFTSYGHAFLFENAVSPDLIASTARAPFLLVFALLLLTVFFAARSRFGTRAALFAVALLAFDPNLNAHAGVVHTDLGAALGFLAAVLAWDEAWRHPGPGRLAAAALILGLALATKFSCVYLIPILLLQSLLGSRASAAPGQTARRALLAWCGVVLAAGLVVLAIYTPVTARMDRAEQKEIIHEMVGLRGAPGLSRRIEGLVPISRPLAHYLGGLAAVARQNAVGGGVNFLDGRASVEGFPSYFFVALAAKSTIAFLVLMVLLAAQLILGGRGAREEAVIFLVPAAVLLIASIGSAYNIGIRHLLPVYPLFAMAGAGLFRRVAKAPIGNRQSAIGNRLAVAALWLLPLLSAVELLRIHPHELSYFNPFVGGPVRGREILSDSNIDWGLDLRRLAAELRRRGIANPTVVYFGGDDVFYRTGVPDFSADPTVRGRFVAISAFHLAVGPEYYAYHGATEVAGALAALRKDLAARWRPAGRVGYSTYLFELPAGGNP